MDNESTQAPLLTRTEIMGDIQRVVAEALARTSPASAPNDANTAQVCPLRDKPGEPDTHDPTKDAKVQQGVAGIVRGLDDIKLFDVALPVGSALLGLPTGVIVGEVIDGFIPRRTADNSINFMNVAAKGVGAWGMLSFGRNLVGKQAATFAAAALLLQVLSTVLPIDEWVSNIVNAVSGIGKAKEEEPLTEAPARNAAHQAEAVAAAYQINHYRGSL